MRISKNNFIFRLKEYILIFKRYIGAKIYYIFLLTFFAVTCESIGILMLAPLLQSLNKDPNANPSILSSIIDLNDSRAPIIILMLILISYILKGFLTFSALKYNAKIRGKLLGDLKWSLFRKYSKLDYKYFISNQIGYLASIINEKTRAMVESFYYIVQVVVQLINAFILIIIAFIIGPVYALISTIGGVLVFIVFNAINSYIRRESIRYTQVETQISGILYQLLNSFKYLKATNNSDFFNKAFFRQTDELSRLQRNMGIAYSITFASREPIAVTLILIMFFTQIYILRSPVTDLFISVILYYRGLNCIVSSQISWQQAMEYIGSVETIRDESNTQNKNLEEEGKIIIRSLYKGIEFRSVTLGFNNQDKASLSNVSLFIPVNKTIGIAGPSGSGKSTLIDMLTLSVNPDKGDIFVDNKSSREISKRSWRDSIGYVSQDSVIFNGSIAQNIAMIDEIDIESKSILEKVYKAAKQAHIDEHINTLPNGYFTSLGDNGVNLSGGQRQRICIARELYRNPKLLLLDEASSALDSNTESLIQRNLNELSGKMTMVVVSHRLATIEKADYIYYIEGGEIIEEGSYDYLISKENGKFRSMLALQTKEK